MADNTHTPPGTARAVRGRTRRQAFTALGVTALAGIAVAGFARSDRSANLPVLEGDTALLAACAAFDAAHRAVERDNATAGSDEKTERLGREWYQALNAVTDSPRPQTPAGRTALARAARIALVDQVATTIGETFDDQATAEERLVLAALDSMVEARA